MKRVAVGWIAVALAGLMLVPGGASAGERDYPGAYVFGIKVRAGGRYDDVRMCVGSPPGVKGGPAMDVSLFAEMPVGDGAAVEVDLPFFRPIMFAAAFGMLQFEPSATLKLRAAGGDNVDLIAGPSLGISLHYGPDFESDKSGEDRGASFFALGPTIGGYIGMDFPRPNERFNFQLGLTPYVTPLFGVKDSEDHKGIVIGGLLDGQFRFR
jgi:hypothetical protein